MTYEIGHNNLQYGPMILRKILKKIISKLRPRQYDRNDFLKSIPNDKKILEIGPFYSPVQKGDNVKYFDVLDKTELQARAKKIDPNYNLENVPHIDYVSPTADLNIIDEKFDAVFSSHVIEHQFNLIDHLQKVSKLLSIGGKYYLIVPDKRYCFDHFQQVSTIADVINAHYENRKKHSLKSTLEHRALVTHNISIDHWKGEHGELSGIAEKIKDAIEEYNNNDFIDVHALYFTPTSFHEIFNLLYNLNYIDLKITRIYETPKDNIEFCCELEKTGA